MCKVTSKNSIHFVYLTIRGTMVYLKTVRWYNDLTCEALPQNLSANGQISTLYTDYVVQQSLHNENDKTFCKKWFNKIPILPLPFFLLTFSILFFSFLPSLVKDSPCDFSANIFWVATLLSPLLFVEIPAPSSPLLPPPPPARLGLSILIISCVLKSWLFSVYPKFWHLYSHKN